MKKAFPFFIYLTVAFTLYFNSFSNDFILDDFPQIVENPRVLNPLQLLPALQQSTLENGIYYKPLMTITYNALWHLGNGSPYPFHLFQTLLHSLNAFLIFFIFLRLTSKYSFSFFCGLVFLIHPINSEAVLMIADLQESLFSFFGLSALLMIPFLRPYKYSFAVTLLFSFSLLLGLLSKETALLYLFIAVIYAKIYHNELFKRTLFCSLAACVSYLILRLGVAQLSSLHSDNMQIMRADFLTRLLTIPQVLTHYIHVFFYPKNISLTQDWVTPSPTLSEFWLPLLEVALLITGLLTLLIRTQSKHLTFFSIWFLAGWLAHSQVVPIDGTVSDRWFYFPIIGLTGLILYSATNIVRQKWFVVGALCISFGLTLRTYIRTQDWESAFKLYSREITIQPDSFYVNNNLGLELLKLERPQEALPYFQKTIDVSPTKSQAWLTGWRNLGATYLNLNQYDNAENCFKNAILDGDVKSFRGLSVALYNQKKIAELKTFLTEIALPKFQNDPHLNNILKLITK